MAGNVAQCYAALAKLANVSEDQLEKEHFTKIIEVSMYFVNVRNPERTIVEERQKWNRILGAILAEDILRAQVVHPNNFLQGDAWLSKHLIAALIDPKDDNFITDMIEIFKAALCEQKIIAKYIQLVPVDPTGNESSMNVAKEQTVHQNLTRIFPSLTSSERNRWKREEFDEDTDAAEICEAVCEAVVGHIKKMSNEPSPDSSVSSMPVSTGICEQIAEESPTASSMCANFLLNCCPDVEETVFTIGTLLFWAGFALMLSPVVTAIPSVGLTTVPSVVVGGVVMGVGAGMMLAASLGFFGSSKSSNSDETNKPRGGLYFRTGFYSSY